MFNIAMDESGKTCNAVELVKNKSEAEVANAKKHKYFCVACVDERHSVSLNIRNSELANAANRNYQALAWFSHHGGVENGVGCFSHDPCSETAACTGKPSISYVSTSDDTIL